MAQTRLPRFRRVAAPAPLELTWRDRHILQQVHRHRFLRSSQLVALLGGSRQHLLRRLQRLYHHGYLERPRAQLDYFQAGGSRPLVYGLGNRGFALLKRELSLPFHRLKWAGSGRLAGRLFLEHALLTADILVALELACRRHGAMKLLVGEDLPLPAAAQDRREVFHWRVDVRGRVKCGVIPDQVFGLEFPDGQRQFYFLEADRGTMPVVRRNLAQSSCFRKLLAYEATWTQGLHRSRFGFPRFRVLTVTGSAGRVSTLVESCQGLARGRGLFLFAEAAAFLADPFGIVCRNGHGELEALGNSTGNRRQGGRDEESR